MDPIACPHCSTANDPDSRFCESCGKALPDPRSAEPRVVNGSEIAASRTGQAVQSEALDAQARKAAGALLAVAILQAIFGAILLFTARGAALGDPDLEVDAFVIGSVCAVAALFFGLYLWARRNPLPAAIVGLVVYATLHLLEAVADPSSIARGIIVKLIIVIVLVKAIQAGMQHRRLLRGSVDNEV